MNARRMLLGLVALFALAFTAQAAIPSTAISFSSTIYQRTISSATPFSTDYAGNTYTFYTYNTQVIDTHAVATSGTTGTGTRFGNDCSANQNWPTASGLSGGILKAFTVVNNNNWPATSTSAVLYGLVCTNSVSGACNIVGVPVAIGSTSTCAVDTTNAFVAVASSQIAACLNSVQASALTSQSGYVMTADPATGKIALACGGTSVYVVSAPSTIAATSSASFTGATSTAYIGTPVLNNIVALQYDANGSLWVAANGGASTQSSVQVLIPSGTNFQTPNNICGTTLCGSGGNWVFQSTQNVNPNGLTADRSGNIYISFGSAPWAGLVFSFPYNSVITIPTTAVAPSTWAYFSTTGVNWPTASGVTIVGGPMYYDPYQGRLLFNNADNFYAIPLIAVAFSVNQTPVGYDANGASCTVGTASCYSVTTLTSGVNANFNLRVYASSVPGTATNSLAISFQASVNGAITTVNTVTGFTTLVGGASIASNYAISLNVPATGLVTIRPVVTYVGSTTDASAYLFASNSGVQVVVQGAINLASATPALSTSWPYSSNVIMANVPSTYTLVASPSISTGCSAPTLTSLASTLAGSVSGVSTVSFVNSQATVSVTHITSGTQSWSGIFSGTGCSFSVGLARVPSYILNVQVNVNPSIAITSTAGTSLTSNVNPTVNLLASPIAVASGSPSVAFTSSVVGSGICAGAYTTASPVFNTGSWSATPGTFQAGGNACAISRGNTALLIGTVTLSGTAQTNLANYYYIDASTLLPTLVGSRTTTVAVAQLTAPLSVSVNWDSAATLASSNAYSGFPSFQTVAPGSVVGPFKVSVLPAGSAASPQIVSVSFTDNLSPAGTFFVATSSVAVGGAYTVPTAPVNSASGFVNSASGTIVAAGVAVNVQDNTFVWYRAPNYAANYRFGLLPGGGSAPAGGLTISAGSSTSYVSYQPGATTQPSITINGIASLSYNTIFSIAGSSLSGLFAFAGRQSYSRNNVTLSVGYPVVAASQFVITVTNNPSATTTGSAGLVTGLFLGTAGSVPTAAQWAATTANTATVTVTIPAGSSSATFVLAGGNPGDVLSFTIARPVTNPGDSTVYIANSFPTVTLLGQIRIESIPSQFLVNVPAMFQASIDPLPTSSYTVSVSDTAGNGTPDFRACADISRGNCIQATASGVTGVSSFDIALWNYAANTNPYVYAPVSTGGIVSFMPDAGTFQLQYTPPAVLTSGAGAYPTLGGTPIFTFTTANTNYVFTTVAPVTTYATLSLPTNTQFKLQLGGSPNNLAPLQGSVALTFMNYDDATNGVLGNSQSPIIGVQGAASSTTFYYPLGTGLNNIIDSTAEGLPLPTSSTGPSYSFLSGQKYAIAVTTYPPVASTSSLSVGVKYVDNNNPNGITTGFDFNRFSSSASSIAGSPAHSSSTLNIFQSAVGSLASTGIDAGVKDVLTTGTTLASAICPSIAQDASNQNMCSIGLFWWTVPTTIVPGAAGAKLQFTVNAGSATNYVTQSQAISVKQWCGFGSTFRSSVINALSYGVATQLSYTCSPALSATQFIEISELNSAISAVSRPQSRPTGTTLPITTWTASTATATPVASSAFWFHVPAVTSDLADTLLTGTANGNGNFVLGSRSYLQFRVTGAVSPFNSDSNAAVVRIAVPITGTYTVSLSNQVLTQPPALSTVCSRAVGNFLLPAAVLPQSVASTSFNTGTLCLWPFAGTSSSTLSLTDGLVYSAAPTTSTASFALSGVASEIPVLTGSTGSSNGQNGGLLVNWAAGTNQGINFWWNLNSAALQVANFSICNPLPTTGVNYQLGTFTSTSGTYAYGGCSATATTAGSSVAANLPTQFVYTNSVKSIQYRPLPTAGSNPTQASNSYQTYSVPISVSMAWKSLTAGIAITSPRATALSVESTPTDLIVGQTYSFELRTASTLISPAQNGLTVTVSDVCGIFTSGVLATNTAPSITSSNPAGGQWSQTTLYYAPGETTKTLFYTPNSICAPVGSNNYQLAFTVTVCTDSTTQCTDGKNLQFVAPWLINFNSWGAVTVSGIPAQVAAGQTVNNIGVSVQPALSTSATTVLPGFIPSDVKVTVSDRQILGATPSTASMGGSFISAQYTGATTLLPFTPAAQAARTISYVAPTTAFITQAAPTANGITVQLSGASSAYFRIVAAAARSIYTPAANIVQSTTSAANFDLTVVTEAFNAANSASGANPLASITGVFFNVVSGSTVSGASSATLATTSSTQGTFIGNAAAGPAGQANAITFNNAFVPGVNLGYFASVPFTQSAVVVNVATSASQVFVTNNGWPNVASSGVVSLPNALSGYVTPVFFLTPGLNTFLVAAPMTGGVSSMAYGSAASSTASYADGDGLVYRFTIARDTITNFGLYVSPASVTNALQAIPWASLLTRLSATPQFVAPPIGVSSSVSLLTTGPGSANVQTTSFSVSVDYGVQSVGVFANFYGTLRAKVSTNLNEAGSIITNLANNQLVNFPLVTPTQMANVPSAATVITLLGGGLGPQTITINRAGKSVFIYGTNIRDTTTGPCIIQGSTTITLNAAPNGLPNNPSATRVLFIQGSYQFSGSSLVTLSQSATSSTLNWASTTGASFSTLAALSPALPTFTSANLPITLNIQAVYPPTSGSTTNVPSEFTGYTNYQLAYCSA